MSSESRYAALGVDVHKRGIESLQRYVDNLFPEAFCVVTADPDFPAYGNVLHGDGAGSKTVQNYLHFRETGDPSVFAGAAHDVLAMNLNDIGCIDARPLAFIDDVQINRRYVPKEAFLDALASGFAEALALLRDYGIRIAFAGGETADLPDQVRTVSVSGALSGRVKLDRAIIGTGVRAGDAIVGLRSDGKAVYEPRQNSGIMANGLTLARHALMHPSYERQHPEIRDPEGEGYTGRLFTTDFRSELGMTLGEALTAPTRLYAPAINAILQWLGRDVHAIVHSTGGGQTKILRVGQGIRYVKDALPEPPPIFQLIQSESGTDWREMHEVFNLGVGLDVVVPGPRAAEAVKEAEHLGIGAQITGRCEKSSEEHNRLVIASRFGTFEYSAQAA